MGTSDARENENPQADRSRRDNGEGIDPELLPRLFQLFTQADRSLAHSQGGLESAFPWFARWSSCTAEQSALTAPDATAAANSYCDSRCSPMHGRRLDAAGTPRRKAQASVRSGCSSSMIIRTFEKARA